MSDSGLRLRSIRLKPGVMADGLVNALSGLGTELDPRYSNTYGFRPLSPEEIEAAYRGSGMMRKAIKVRITDKIRAGRDWQAEDDQIQAIEKEERRLGLKQKLFQAELLRALGGGAFILGVPGLPAQPIGNIGKGKLAFIQVVNRWQLQARDWITDPTLEGYGGPAMWQVSTATGLVDIHPSRVIAFRGDPLPNMAGSADEDLFWGENKIEQMLAAVENSDTAQGAFAALISKARSTIVGIPELSDTLSTEGGEARVRSRIRTMMQLESLFHAIIRDAGDGTPGAGETVEHRQVSWAGIRDIMYAYATFVAAMADVPVTRLMGTAAEGMNASGDSQQRDYHKSISAEQDLSLAPCLDALDAMLIPSALGSRPDEIWWKFAPLDVPTEKEESERFKTVSEALKNIGELAVMPEESFNEAAQNTLVESGFMPGLDSALAKIKSDEERFGLTGEEEEEEIDPSKLVAANENEPTKRAANDTRFIADAAPKTLYIERKLLNADEVIRWAKGQGLETTIAAADMHVTIAFSRQPVDWFDVGTDWSGDENGKIRVRPGGPRAVERLGDGEAVVLLFSDDHLEYRHKRIREAGASWDWPDFRPHVTLTWKAPDVDVSEIEPYAGPLVFGPELFSEVKEDWKEGITEK